jgi:NAD(P)-dependent dehydrogenase (short-subunit alcohol dehydrogenase family)
MRFSGKTAFVTGGASGIGAASVRRFADEGASVAVADIDFTAAKNLASVLPSAIAVDVDVRDPVSVETAVAVTERHFGAVDIIFNNAGMVGEQAPLHESTLENWRSVMNLNGDGIFHVLKYGIGALLRRGGGTIVNTSSVYGLVGAANTAPYHFTKTGLVGLTRSVALEYADQGIRVNSVAPTTVLTPLVEAFIAGSADPEGLRAGMFTFNPLPGIVEASDVAAAVVFLASDEARFITGVTLPVDGGYTAG